MQKSTETRPCLYDDREILACMQDPGRRELGCRMLVASYQQSLYWQVRTMVGCHEDANDVVQNCLVKVFQAIDQFRGDAKLHTWMFRIACNEACTFLRKRDRMMSNDLDSQHVLDGMLADPYLDGDTIQQHLHEAIAFLPTKQREVFVLRYFEQKQYSELSELLETSVGGLKANFHHAVAKIRTHFKLLELL